MRFRKTVDIQIMGRDKTLLPSLHAGYRSGPFTIHKGSLLEQWIVSVNGIKLGGCFYLENAKAMASEFNATPVNWACPFYAELQKTIYSDKALSRALLNIRTKYSGTHRVIK